MLTALLSLPILADSYETIVDGIRYRVEVYPRNDTVFVTAKECVDKEKTNINIPVCPITIVGGQFVSVYIDSYAFSGCSKLTSISLPNNLRKIGYRAFENCYSLTSITIPQSVKHIDSYAFAYCSNLSSVVIPEGVTSIEFDAFQNCSSLSSVVIPESVTEIGWGAFEGCTSLPVVDNCIYAGNILIKFVDKEATSCSIKEGTRLISANAFEDCVGLTSITIPNSVTSIGNAAFYGCI